MCVRERENEEGMCVPVFMWVLWGKTTCVMWWRAEGDWILRRGGEYGDEEVQRWLSRRR